MEDTTCYLVGAGEPCGFGFQKSPGDLIIAADGGFAALQAAQIVPDLCIGDFDSLGYVPEGAIRLPKEKDDTDLRAAVKLGLDRGYRRFVLYGCTGGRMDHTLANIQLLHELSAQGCRAFLMGQAQVLTAVTDGSFSFPASMDGLLSVFSLSDESRDVALTGVKYPLSHAVLTNRFSLGVSNEFLGIPASAAVGSGTLLLVFSRSAYERSL